MVFQSEVWRICGRKELIHNSFSSQEAKPQKKDWVTTVKNDLDPFVLVLTFDDIVNMSKNQLREKVKDAFKNTAFESLLKLKEGNSKGEDIIYGSFNLQLYLNMNTKQWWM